jgi:hypothetical protein
MGSFADFLELEILDHVFGAAAFSAAATLHVGLSTTTITDAGGNITEPVGNGYARVAVDNDKVTWSDALAGLVENDITFTFPEASGSWGVIIDFFISDAGTAGNIYLYGTLDVSKTIDSGDTARFDPGDFNITLD